MVCTSHAQYKHIANGFKWAPCRLCLNGRHRFHLHLQNILSLQCSHQQQQHINHKLKQKLWPSFKYSSPKFECKYAHRKVFNAKPKQIEWKCQIQNVRIKCISKRCWVLNMLGQLPRSMHQILLFGFQSYSNRKWEVSKESGVHLTWTPFGNYDGQWVWILMAIEMNTHNSNGNSWVTFSLCSMRWELKFMG